MILMPGIVEPGKDAPLALLGELAAVMLESGRPAKILVPDARTYALLSTAMEQIDIRVERADRLPVLEEAWEEMRGMIHGREDEDGGELAMLLDMLDAAMEADDTPEALREQLRQLYENDALGARPAKLGAIQPLPAGREQSYVISVSLEKGCYRHIRMDADHTLEMLHEAIVDAFGFENDHLHAFFMDNRLWSKTDAYFAKQDNEMERHTDAYSLWNVGLRPGMAFKYVFDFGEEWIFQCKVLRMIEEGTKTPQLVRSVGDAPERLEVAVFEKTGRNDLCPCGSGKKFKKCCGRES